MLDLVLRASYDSNKVVPLNLSFRDKFSFFVNESIPKLNLYFNGTALRYLAP